MARSRKKTPRGYVARCKAGTMRWWRAKSNRALRRAVRSAIDADPLADTLPELREVSDIWASPGDGKHPYWRESPRSDPEARAEWLKWAVRK
jgi:hypothetical protein